MLMCVHTHNHTPIHRRKGIKINIFKKEKRMKSKVYFSREITPEKVALMYKLAGVKLGGKVAVKLHSGEVGNQNFVSRLL